MSQKSDVFLENEEEKFFNFKINGVITVNNISLFSFSLLTVFKFAELTWW